MNRQAAFQTAMCTAAVSGVSACVATFVFAANGSPVNALMMLGALGALGAGSWAMYLGHCRAFAQQKA